MAVTVRSDLVLSHAVVTSDVTGTFNDVGTPMSINVEVIGTGLVIQQYRPPRR